MRMILSYFLAMVPLWLRIRLRKKIVLIYDDAGYGDTLLVGAVARELKKKYRRITVIVNRTRSVMLQNNPWVDHAADRYGGIDLNYHYGKYAVHAGCRNSLLEIMCRKVGIKRPSSSFVDIFLSADEIAWAHERMTAIPRPIVTIQTKSSDFDNGRKSWIFEYWCLLIEKLQKRQCSVILLGERDVDEERFGAVYDFRGATSIRQAIALISVAQLHIGIVSSLMHGAAAVRTPAVILFGGFERYCFHKYETVYALESSVSCAPCFKLNTITTPCPYNKRCMRNIDPPMVLAAIEKVLPQTSRACSPVHTIT